jgi:PTS system nitrogen regulatory IIA component
MRLRDHIARELIFVIPAPGDKRSFLQQAAHLVCQQLTGVEEDVLLARLLAREAQVTTGIGHGVAIPHATLEGLTRSLCVIIQVPAGGVDFQALDTSPVRVLFLLLSPPENAGVHIRLLARIARLADSESFVAALAAAKDQEEIYRLTLEEDARHV